MTTEAFRNPRFTAIASDGTVLSGGKLYTYEAGSTTNEKTTYSDAELSTANANPVILDSKGQADVYFSGTARLRLFDEDDNLVWDRDNQAVQGDINAEWINSLTPTFSSSTTFTLAGDQTDEYHAGRRIRATDSSTLYGYITNSVYSDPNTTVTVSLDSGSLTASLSAVAVGLLSVDNIAYPDNVSVVPATSTTSGGSAGQDYDVSAWPSTLTSGRTYKARLHTANTGAYSIDPGSGSISAKRPDDSDPIAGEAAEGAVLSWYYNGTNLIQTFSYKIGDVVAEESFTMGNSFSNDTGYARAMRGNGGVWVNVYIPAASHSSSSNPSSSIGDLPAAYRPQVGDQISSVYAASPAGAGSDYILRVTIGNDGQINFAYIAVSDGILTARANTNDVVIPPYFVPD